MEIHDIRGLEQVFLDLVLDLQNIAQTELDLPHLTGQQMDTEHETRAGNMDLDQQIGRMFLNQFDPVQFPVQHLFLLVDFQVLIKGNRGCLDLHHVVF
jgi:hypothetical protein